MERKPASRPAATKIGRPNCRSWPKAAARLKLRQTIVDGEVVAFDEHGISQFQILQNAFRRAAKSEKLVYTVFDLLFLDGEDLRDLPLEEPQSPPERSRAPPADRGPIRYTDQAWSATGRSSSAKRSDMASKRIVSAAATGRIVPAAAWIGVKGQAHQRAEFVVGGYFRNRPGRDTASPPCWSATTMRMENCNTPAVSGTGFSGRDAERPPKAAQITGAEPLAIRRLAVTVGPLEGRALGPATVGRRVGLQQLDRRQPAAAAPRFKACAKTSRPSP